MRMIGDIGNFELLKENSALEFGSPKRRVLRLELNCSAPTQLEVQTGPKDLRFLANVEGRESLTFVANGPVTIWATSDGEVWYWSPEMELTAVKLEDPKIFTKMATRQARNPEMERMGHLMMQNFNRMMGRVEKDVGLIKRENARLRAEAAAAAAAAEPAAEPPEPPAEPPAEPPKGKGKGAADGGA